MKRTNVFAGLMPVLLLAICGGNVTEAWAQEAGAVLTKMPKDLAVAAVVTNLEQLDKAFEAIVKKIEPGSSYDSIVEGLKSELGLADCVDFSKPIGFGLAQVPPTSDLPLLWATAPGFASRVKEEGTAKEEDGLWRVEIDPGTVIYVKVSGDDIVVSDDKAALLKALDVKESMADVLQSRLALLRDQDVFMHVNMQPMRSMVLAQMSEMGAMLPMIAMMAGAQSGNPMMMASMLNTGLEAAQKFVEQLAYIELTAKVDTELIAATLSTGFVDGPIKTYLSQQKPAEAPFFMGIPEQPYFMAFAAELPGNESPLVNYFVDKFGAAAAQPGMMSPSPAEGGPPPGEALKESLALAKELYGKLRGGSGVMSIGAGGMTMVGDYLTDDPAAVLELTKKSLAPTNALMQQFSQGVSYEPAGSKQVGGTTVDLFSMKVDTTNPAAAQAAAMYGPNMRFGLGQVGSVVRYYMGDESAFDTAFAAKIATPFGAGTHVKRALETLPRKRNMVMLVDLNGIMPLMMAAMMGGMPDGSAPPPGPPVALSVSLAGEPASLTLHVPVAAIEQMSKSMSAGAPMTPATTTP